MRPATKELNCCRLMGSMASRKARFFPAGSQRIARAVSRPFTSQLQIPSGISQNQYPGL